MGRSRKYANYDGPLGVVEGSEENLDNGDKVVYLMRCPDCGEIHRRTSRDIGSGRKSRECVNYEPTSKKYEDRYDGVLRHAYGITLDDYDRMLEEQGGECAICGKHPTKKRLCVDHDHQTNKVRGLLCEKCNWGIGQFNDTVVLLRNAIEYLEK